MFLARPTTRTLSCLCIIFVPIAMSPAGRAGQEQERIIEKRLNSVTPNEPVSLGVVRTKKGIVEIGKKFKAEDDWLKGLTVRVNNVSDKDIRYISVNFSFERPEDHETADDPPLVHSLTYGSRTRTPDDATQSRRKGTLAPGDSVEISLPDETYEVLERALKKLKYPPGVKRLRMYLTEVIFDDGTAWVSGYWFRSDPENPDMRVPSDTKQL